MVILYACPSYFLDCMADRALSMQYQSEMVFLKMNRIFICLMKIMKELRLEAVQHNIYYITIYNISAQIQLQENHNIESCQFMLNFDYINS